MPLRGVNNGYNNAFECTDVDSIIMESNVCTKHIPDKSVSTSVTDTSRVTSIGSSPALPSMCEESLTVQRSVNGTNPATTLSELSNTVNTH